MGSFMRLTAAMCVLWAGAGAQTQLQGPEPEIGQATDSGASSASYRLQSIRIGGNLEGTASSSSYRMEFYPGPWTVPGGVPQDTTPPVVVITRPSIDTIVNTPTFTVEYSVDGVTGFQKVVSLTEGINIILVDSTDAAGNRGVDSTTINLDTEPPVVRFHNPVDGGFTNQHRTAISWSVDSMPQGYGVIQLLEPGPNTITRTATDLAGNSGTASITVFLDTAAPVVAIVKPSQDTLVSGSSILVQYTVDGNSFSKTFTLAPGENVLRVDSADAAGNIGFDEVRVTRDNQGPLITISPVDQAQLDDLSVRIAVSHSDSGAGLVQASLHAVLDGRDITAELERSQDSSVAILSLDEGSHLITVTMADSLGNQTSTQSAFTCVLPVPPLKITSPENLVTVRDADILVRGDFQPPLTQIRVDGVLATLSGTHFQALVPLIDGRNTLVATAFDSLSNQVTASLTVILDREKPRIYINSPVSGLVVREDSITVTGSVSDRIADIQGQSMPRVRVNGLDAQVVNYTFQAKVPLTQGLNTITAVATDEAGNLESAVASVTLDQAPNPSLTAFSGEEQAAFVFSPLAQPLQVVVRNAANQPVAGVPVLFRVSMGDGTLQGVLRNLQVFTGDDGMASANFTLGRRAGPGANEVKATAEGFVGEAIFHPNALEKPAYRIFTSSGDLQRGLARGLASHPLVALVTDSANNPVAGVPVEFKAKAGGGHFSGRNADTVLTGADGKAAAEFTLGAEEGRDNNIVEASFPGNPALPASFVLSGYISGPPEETKVSGVILDNSNRPLAGVTVRIEESGQQATTGADGTFLLQNAPVGLLHLHVDGTTTSAPGDWVTLMFELDAISGKNNDVGMPIYLVARNNAEGKLASASEDQILTLAEVPGFSLRVPAGSATFPPDVDDHTITVTAVHADKIPMPPGEGLQPRFVISIGPPQVKFDPPAPITYPNVDGLKPGEQAHFYSFDHDLGTYVSIGTGTVSEDGATITSDKGFGIVKGGWHGGGPPNPPGDAEKCHVFAYADEFLLGKGQRHQFHAIRLPGNGTLEWSRGSDQITCESPGDYRNTASYRCGGRNPATSTANAMCVEMTSISTSCAYYEDGKALKKEDFQIVTNPPGLEASAPVKLLTESIDGSGFTGGIGTGTVTVSAGSSTANVTVGVVDPSFTTTVAGHSWDVNTLTDFLKGIEIVTENGCSEKINYSWNFYGTKSPGVCSCQPVENYGIGGSGSIDLASCGFYTTPYPIGLTGLFLRFGLKFGASISAAAVPRLNTRCDGSSICLDLDATGTVGVEAAVCAVNCDLLKVSANGSATVGITGGKLCWEEPHVVRPTIGAPVLTLGGQVSTFDFVILSYTTSFPLSEYF